jgi:hypothetical protein
MNRKNHWDKITSWGKDVCFVCDKRIKPKQTSVCIGKHKYNKEDLYRHDRCDSLSMNWYNKFKKSTLEKKHRVKILLETPTKKRVKIPLLPVKKRVKIPL